MSDLFTIECSFLTILSILYGFWNLDIKNAISQAKANVNIKGMAHSIKPKISKLKVQLFSKLLILIGMDVFFLALYSSEILEMIKKGLKNNTIIMTLFVYFIFIIILIFLIIDFIEGCITIRKFYKNKK